nr:hypothetical protein [Brucella intermedia]
MTNSRFQIRPASTPAGDQEKAFAKQMAAISEALRDPLQILPDSIVQELELEARANGDWLTERIESARRAHAGDQRAIERTSDWLTKALAVAAEAESAKNKLWPSRVS